jgi:uncharacterized protein (TIGR02246 family)
MLRNGWILGTLALAALGAGCASQPVAPPDTRAADIQAVKDVEAQWLKDDATKDPQKFASYYADDASGLYPGSPILNGKDAIQKWATPFFADPNFSLTFTDTRAEASKGGDMVYTQGTYTMTMTDPKTKKKMTDTGKFLTIYRKQADGSWKAIADTFNSDSMM